VPPTAVATAMTQPTHFRGSLFSSIVILDSSTTKSFVHALILTNSIILTDILKFKWYCLKLLVDPV